MTRMKIHLIVLYTLLAGTIAFAVYNSTSKRTAYVNPGELYEAFGMKKELEKKLEITQRARKNMLDSLMGRLGVMQEELSQEKEPPSEKVRLFELLQKDYLAKQEQFGRENDELANKYLAEIYGHINEYIKEYGAAKGYRYIFGANGQGNLMYAEETDNITTEVIQYINERYNGAAKK